MSQKEEEQVILDYCDSLIGSFKDKADHNKTESLRFFWTITISTLLVPIFVAFGPGLIFGKILPSLLSLLAAISTSWLQLRKPQQLWALYRTAQREVEDNKTRYHFKIDCFDGVTSPEKLLAEKVADISIQVHRNWVPLIPSPENLKGLEKEIKNAGG